VLVKRQIFLSVFFSC